MSIKEGDMVSIRQDFINRYKDVQESIVKAMDKALERAIWIMMPMMLYIIAI